MIFLLSSSEILWCFNHSFQNEMFGGKCLNISLVRPFSYLFFHRVVVYPTQRWYYFCAPDEYLENDKSISVNSYELQGLPLDLCDNPTVVSTDNQFGKKKKSIITEEISLGVHLWGVISFRLLKQRRRAPPSLCMVLIYGQRSWTE